MVIINSCIRYHSEEDETKLIKRRSGSALVSNVSAEWAELLRRRAPERDLQTFLERYPHYLPGLWDLHNGPLHDVVVTKFPLGVDHRTDFAFISRHSMALQFTFVELESLEKPIFAKKGASFHGEFNKARQQISDWISWAERNKPQLMEMFSPMFETHDVSGDHAEFRYYLVYGRRNEMGEDRQRKERWQSVFLSSDRQIGVMSYDRLRPEHEKTTDLIVCTYEQRGFYVKGSVL